MVRFQTVWLAPVALAIFGVGLGAKRASSQTTYTLNASYDILAYARTITPNISTTTLSGLSTDAPYDLTQISGLTYSQVDATTGLFRFNTDPTVFGLQGISKSEVVFFGSGSNKLFGSDNATGVIDFTTLTARANGTFTITGGEGIFAGATGTLAFSEVDTLSLDPTIPTLARATVNGSFQVVPSRVSESGNMISLIGTGVMGIGWLLRRRNIRVAR